MSNRTSVELKFRKATTYLKYKKKDYKPMMLHFLLSFNHKLLYSKFIHLYNNYFKSHTTIISN